MKKFYSSLKGSTKCYLLGLLNGLLGLIYIDPQQFVSMPTIRLVAILNVVFVFFKIASIILLIIGIYESYREFKKEKNGPHKELKNKSWFKFIKIVGFIMHFALLFYLIGGYVNVKNGFIIVFLYIFIMRFLRRIFYYVTLGNKTIK